MKKSIIAILLCVAGIKLSYAQVNLPASIPTNAPKEQQEILDLSKSKWVWMADKNVESLSGLFENNCVFVHMGGS